MADGKCNDIAIEIRATVTKVEASIETECCIYKVPHEIRKLNEDAYTPKVISIGPFHHGNPILQKMESKKKVCLAKFLRITETESDNLFSRVEELEPRVRSCYSEDINFLKEDFIEMILLDAGFILYFFCLHSYWGWQGDDALLLEIWLMDSIIRDLCLLENQLPFFVLNELYNLTFAKPPNDNRPTFFHLTSSVLASQNKQHLVPEYYDTICHFTDLLRTFHLQSSSICCNYRGERSTDPNTVNEFRETGINTVNKLREAGIKFRANRTSPCLLDLRFSGRTLKIPQLTLDDETEILFCNMIALEQCHHRLHKFITDYIYVLSRLIQTDEDADVLVKNGIIVNHLDRNNNMARLFYHLGKNAPVLSFKSGYHPLLKKLKKFCKNPRMRMVATLRRDYYLDLKRTYCKTPLQTLATLGGIFLLVLTVIQTICSILQVV